MCRYRTGLKHLRHPVAGDLVLALEVMDLPADDGLILTACAADPGSASHDALKFLASRAGAAGRDGKAAKSPGPGRPETALPGGTSPDTRST